MKKIPVLFLLLMVMFPCLVLDAQINAPSVKPRIMVRPYIKQEDNANNLKESDTNMRIAIAKVKEAFSKQGYIIVNTNADIIVDAEVEILNSSTGNSVRIILTANETSTGNLLANSISESGKFYTKDYGKLVSKAVERGSDKFLNTIQNNINLLTQYSQTPAIPNQTIQTVLGNIAVDKNVYVNPNTDSKTFVVIIGNEKYSEVAEVPFAENDARVFCEYCIKTLGIAEKHVRLCINATYNDIRRSINWLRQGIVAYEGDVRVIFYYAGHGIPDEAEKSAYLLPVDGIGSDIESAYSLAKLYQELSELPAQSITVFLDACFSGTKRDGQMMASARGVAIKTKPTEAKGKMVIFTAAQGDETAYPYKSQQHGMFTYYLLKKLQETKGEATLEELSNYLTKEVKRQSFDENNKIQTPTVKASEALRDSWRKMKLKQ